MVEIPDHLKSAIAETLRVEGGYNPHDKHGLPTYRGITSETWQKWLRSNKSIHITERQAGEDLTYIAGRSGGRSHSGLDKASYEHLAPQIFHKDYFTDYGFDKIHSEKIQKFVMEISFHRGPDSARWAMMYAAGIEARDSDPLLKEKLTKSEKRRHAVDYANAFLALGQAPNQHTLDEDKNKPVNAEAENRFYGRLRVAKLVEESHFVAYGKDGALSRARGLFNRAFDYQWPQGLTKEHPGLDPTLDKYFLATYHNFLDIHQSYNQNHNKDAFDAKIKATSVGLAVDPCSPLNQKKNPDKKADCPAPPSTHSQPSSPPTAHEPSLWEKTKWVLSHLDPRPTLSKLGHALNPMTWLSWAQPDPGPVVRFDLPPTKDYSVKANQSHHENPHQHSVKAVPKIAHHAAENPAHHHDVEKSKHMAHASLHPALHEAKPTSRETHIAHSATHKPKVTKSVITHDHDKHPVSHDAHVSPPKLPANTKSKPATAEHHHR